MPGGRRHSLLLAASLLAAAVPAAAQPAGSFLFINQERILTGSKTGQQLLAEEDRERDALRADARALDSAFEEEERRLTDQRPTLSPEDFRKLSDAFDARVVRARRDQDARASQLAQEFEQRRRQFYARVAPILVMLMDRNGARAIFDETSVLLADQSLNITDAVIAEIDAQAAAPGAGTTPMAPDSLLPAPPASPVAPEATAPGATAPEGAGNEGAANDGIGLDALGPLARPTGAAPAEAPAPVETDGGN